jgi:CHAD domain-containing protein
MEALSKRVNAFRAQVERVRRYDVQGVHDMRVASRRLRAALREHRDALEPETADVFADEVRRVTRLLGRPRERDVMLEMMTHQRDISEGPRRKACNAVLRTLQARRKALNAQCDEAVLVVLAPSFEDALFAMFDELHPTKDCYLEWVADHLDKEYRRLCASYDAWCEVQEEESLHAVRVAFKKMRYACETHAAIYGVPLQRFLQRLKATQELLGDWNDARVLREELTSLLPSLSREVVGEVAILVEEFQQHGAILLESFSAGAKDFFSRSRRASARKVFGTATLRCCRRIKPGGPIAP